MTNEIIGGKYRVKGEIGQGGTAKVYRARTIFSPEDYAIKVISTADKDSTRLLEREAEILKRLDHDNIVKFIEHGYEQELNVVYLVLEYIEGESAREYFNSGISIQSKFDLFLQVLDAVDYAHSKDVRMCFGCP